MRPSLGLNDKPEGRFPLSAYVIAPCAPDAAGATVSGSPTVPRTGSGTLRRNGACSDALIAKEFERAECPCWSRTAITSWSQEPASGGVPFRMPLEASRLSQPGNGCPSEVQVRGPLNPLMLAWAENASPTDPSKGLATETLYGLETSMPKGSEIATAPDASCAWIRKPSKGPACRGVPAMIPVSRAMTSPSGSVPTIAKVTAPWLFST